MKHRFELRLHNGSVYATSEHDNFRQGFKNICESLFECLRNGVADEVTVVYKNKERQQDDEEIWRKIL